MKKFLPLFILFLGIFSFVIAFMFLRNRNKEPEVFEEEEMVTEIPFELRPFTSLTPSEDGHWLTLHVGNIRIEAATLDYELLYKVGDGRTQGVPGTIKLEGTSEIERELLLGSESSGKFRYDEGVETGTLTLRFRNEKGKLVGKLSTDFQLQSGEETLSSVSGAFKYMLTKPVSDFFVTMETFGVPEEFSGDLIAGPYGVFGPDDGFSGEVEIEGKALWWDGLDWEALVDNQASAIGVFVGVEK